MTCREIVFRHPVQGSVHGEISGQIDIRQEEIAELLVPVVPGEPEMKSSQHALIVKSGSRDGSALRRDKPGGKGNCHLRGAARSPETAAAPSLRAEFPYMGAGLPALGAGEETVLISVEFLNQGLLSEDVGAGPALFLRRRGFLFFLRR